MRHAIATSADSSQMTHSSAAVAPAQPGAQLLGFDAQNLIITLLGVAGAIFVLAAMNMLNRLAPAKVRKR